MHRGERKRPSQARAAGVSRGLKEADDGNADTTNRNRIQGLPAEGNRAMDRDARTHPDRRAGKSGVARVKDEQLTLGDLRPCPVGTGDAQRCRTRSQKSAEAVVVRGT